MPNDVLDAPGQQRMQSEPPKNPREATTMMKKQPTSDLVADLTWAELYARNIRQDLKLLSPAVKKIETEHKVTESAALLRRQLEDANRTTGELRKMTGVAPRRPD
jgi:hypothetical protein